MNRERLNKPEPKFDTRSAIVRLLAGVPPKQIFGVAPTDIRITYDALDADYTQQNYKGTVNPHIKMIINTLRTAASESVNDRLTHVHLKGAFPSDATPVNGKTLETLQRRATDAFDLINPNVYVMLKHPDAKSIFELTLVRLQEYFVDAPKTVRDRIFVRIISERHTRERLPAYIELLANIYKRDTGATPTMKTLRALMFSSLPVFTKPTRFNVAYFSAVNEYASVQTGIFTHRFKFNNDAFTLSRSPRLSVALKPEIQKLIDDEYKEMQTYIANQLVITGCPANKEPLPESDAATSLLMTILHKSIIPGM